MITLETDPYTSPFKKNFCVFKLFPGAIFAEADLFNAADSGPLYLPGDGSGPSAMVFTIKFYQIWQKSHHIFLLQTGHFDFHTFLG